MGARLATAVACLAVAALAGCGQDELKKGKHPEALRGSGNNDPTVRFPRQSKVAIRDDGYHPKRISVSVDTTVRWTNRGDRTHTVSWVSGRGGRFNSGPIKPGEDFAFRVPRVSRLVYESKAPGDEKFRGVIEAG